MRKNITKETINAIKDGAVVELGADAKVEYRGKSVVFTIDDKVSTYSEEDYTESKIVKYINMQIDHSNHKELYNIINTLFTEMDYNLSFRFGDYTLGLFEDEEADAAWWENGVYIIPTNAKDENGDWDWDAATYFSIEPYFRTYADLLRGDRDIIGDMTNSILDFMETDTPYPSTGGTTETHKTEVVE